MRYTTVKGRNGDIRMAKIALGTNYFGTNVAEETAFALLDAYVAAGGNVIDTARAYAEWLPGGASASERTIGKWLKARGCRDQIVLITKGGYPTPDAPRRPRLSERELRHDLEKSLETLGVDSVDVYFLHCDDERIPTATLADIADRIVREGRARAVGASNWRAARLRQANAYAAKTGKTPFAVSQIQWSYAHCTPEMWRNDTLVCMSDAEYAAYRELGIPVMAFSSQAKGFFLKLIANGRDALPEKLRPLLCPENDRRLARLLALSEETGISPAALSICYITCGEVDGISLIGCSSLDQLKESLEPADLAIAPDMLRRLRG